MQTKNLSAKTKTSPKKYNSREISLRILYGIEEEGLQASDGIDFYCGENKTSNLDRRFITELVNGTTKLRRRIDFGIQVFLKEKLEKLLGAEELSLEHGQLKVAAIFRRDINNTIFGGPVIGGKILADSLIKIVRGGAEIGQGKLIELQSGKERVKEVVVGQECGIKFAGKVAVEIGDTVICYTVERKERKL